MKTITIIVLIILSIALLFCFLNTMSLMANAFVGLPDFDFAIGLCVPFLAFLWVAVYKQIK